MKNFQLKPKPRNNFNNIERGANYDEIITNIFRKDLPVPIENENKSFKFSSSQLSRRHLTNTDINSGEEKINNRNTNENTPKTKNSIEFTNMASPQSDLIKLNNQSEVLKKNNDEKKHQRNKPDKLSMIPKEDLDNKLIHEANIVSDQDIGKDKNLVDLLIYSKDNKKISITITSNKFNSISETKSNNKFTSSYSSNNPIDNRNNYVNYRYFTPSSKSKLNNRSNKNNKNNQKKIMSTEKDKQNLEKNISGNVTQNASQSIKNSISQSGNENKILKTNSSFSNFNNLNNFVKSCTNKVNSSSNIRTIPTNKLRTPDYQSSIFNTNNNFTTNNSGTNTVLNTNLNTNLNTCNNSNSNSKLKIKKESSVKNYDSILTNNKINSFKNNSINAREIIKFEIEENLRNKMERSPNSPASKINTPQSSKKFEHIKNRLTLKNSLDKNKKINLQPFSSITNNFKNKIKSNSCKNDKIDFLKRPSSISKKIDSNLELFKKSMIPNSDRKSPSKDNSPIKSKNNSLIIIKIEEKKVERKSETKPEIDISKDNNVENKSNNSKIQNNDNKSTGNKESCQISQLSQISQILHEKYVGEESHTHTKILSDYTIPKKKPRQIPKKVDLKKYLTNDHQILIDVSESNHNQLINTLSNTNNSIDNRTVNIDLDSKRLDSKSISNLDRSQSSNILIHSNSDVRYTKSSSSFINMPESKSLIKSPYLIPVVKTNLYDRTGTDGSNSNSPNNLNSLFLKNDKNNLRSNSSFFDTFSNANSEKESVCYSLSNRSKIMSENKRSNKLNEARDRKLFERQKSYNADELPLSNRGFSNDAKRGRNFNFFDDGVNNPQIDKINEKLNSLCNNFKNKNTDHVENYNSLSQNNASLKSHILNKKINMINSSENIFTTNNNKMKTYKIEIRIHRNEEDLSPNPKENEKLIDKIRSRFKFETSNSINK